ncbi:SDR family oxidoreductase [Spirosoma utsteinense]|uniref:NAD(P)-dependent dehydrogenase (Short-subunit alcohol dehydrogenase family) n=1 Tax=Spirosoma utsteinense TaxID=2585773 RepID=A0ABR6W9G7_9BACT|nr:SDR family oxidoreductase [Spirosoma utsteinense]MBC3787204.1 NAD(P)-dependent dehydrogenase (short-subunit alcohol dehydrogenase family) [Spirosoma utsteinense]MBC3792889.1 NAD(P)-dependent dehydrogenase (short-subunit alcohol dehydrogenase family) [Spirosoma utsteinense]
MSKVIFITGASSGIGKAAAILFAQRGWNVAATMRHPEKETELTQYPAIKLYTLDVTQPDSVAQAVEQALQDWPRIDVLVNNAGYGLFGPMETVSEEKIMDQFQTNVFGTMRTIKALTPHFRQAGGGTIINITSIGGLVGLPFNSIYHATKFGVDGLSESLNYELRPFNIRVKIVAPGGVATDFATRSLKQTMEGASVYDESIQQVFAAFSKRGGNYSTGEQIAGVIYEAATDDSDRLRYVAGEDAQNLYAQWKEMSNEDFFAMINQGYGLGQ